MFAQRLDYIDEMPAMKERLTLSGGQTNWFIVPKPIDELHNTAKDPWQLNNAAGIPECALRLAGMRLTSEAWPGRNGDTGRLPDAILMEEM